ncbi:4a-hydroxytetrahydrobiopterin dehydratase [Cupriavidus necator]|uniref:4a-hydroxytetrahydrobiopterin dehydratase n=1 Tax=Cupriavidus necator TaxID=106590 RepID=UPI0039C0EF97
MEPFIFINYRREDTISAARALLRFLHAHYGRDSVFMDIPEIRYGDRWENSIEIALKRANVVIPLIGSRWLTLTDQYGNRRIDKPDDWVVNEISYSIKSKKRIYPIYIDAPLLSVDELPERLGILAKLQAFEIREGGAEEIWRKLCAVLQVRDGFPPPLPNVAYPRATVRLHPLTRSELRARLENLEGWVPVASPLPGAEHVIRSELYKRFEFSSFRKAIQFMNEAVPGINERQHHPRWENIWRNVDIWLSTWDIQFQISELDLDLAAHLNETAKRVRDA